MHVYIYLCAYTHTHIHVYTHLSIERQREYICMPVCEQTHKYLHIAHTYISINMGKTETSRYRKGRKLKSAAVPLPPHQTGNARKDIRRWTKYRASPQNLILHRLEVVTFNIGRGRPPEVSRVQNHGWMLGADIKALTLVEVSNCTFQSTLPWAILAESRDSSGSAPHPPFLLPLLQLLCTLWADVAPRMPELFV